MRRRNFLVSLALLPVAGAAEAGQRVRLPGYAPAGAIIVSTSQKRCLSGERRRCCGLSASGSQSSSKLNARTNIAFGKDREGHALISGKRSV